VVQQHVLNRDLKPVLSLRERASDWFKGDRGAAQKTLIH
jgi:hypothetical protein